MIYLRFSVFVLLYTYSLYSVIIVIRWLLFQTSTSVVSWQYHVAGTLYTYADYTPMEVRSTISSIIHSRLYSWCFFLLFNKVSLMVHCCPLLNLNTEDLQSITIPNPHATKVSFENIKSNQAKITPHLRDPRGALATRPLGQTISNSLDLGRGIRWISWYVSRKAKTPICQQNDTKGGFNGKRGEIWAVFEWSTQPVGRITKSCRQQAFKY
jgi:hypothetical protein